MDNVGLRLHLTDTTASAARNDFPAVETKKEPKKGFTTMSKRRCRVSDDVLESLQQREANGEKMWCCGAQCPVQH